MTMFDPECLGSSSFATFEDDFKNNFANGNLTDAEIDEFVAFIDQVTDERNSEAYCQEVWEAGGSRYRAMPGEFRNALKYVRDVIASIKQEA
ncbi:hypothetical protein [Candidatus Raskinella chloraquaticus]|uniref:hypothetical protein n=1 Tax=Candidatus Raskinella chloraquaticus TaxID=1951219 RepID=UPI00366C134C